MHVQSCCFALSSYCFFTFSSPPHLKLPIIYDTLWSVRNRIFSVQNELFLLIASETFFDSSVVPLFLVRKVENGSFPCTHKLGERTGKVWRHNIHRVRTHENNSRETVRRLGTIIHSIFVPNQEPASAWIFGNGPVRVGTQGLFRPSLKTFVPPILPRERPVPELPACRRLYWHGHTIKKKKKKRLHFGCLAVKASETKDFLKSILNAHITIGNWNDKYVHALP